VPSCSRVSASRHARAFGRQVDQYERGRPDWPEAALDRAVRELGLEPDANALDLAAGTGKLTRLLVRRLAGVVAVEPDAAMLAKLEELVDEAVGDAFHWFDASAALGEIARVLRPGGGLALLWNAWDGEAFDPPLPQQALELLRAVFNRAGRPAGPSYEAGPWREAFTDSPFAPLGQDQFASEVVLDADQVISLGLSVSSVAALPRPDRDGLEKELRRLLAGKYMLPIRTDLYWTRLTC
jgi:SAM-dependent methyltransferase